MLYVYYTQKCNTITFRRNVKQSCPLPQQDIAHNCNLYSTVTDYYRVHVRCNDKRFV